MGLDKHRRRADVILDPVAEMFIEVNPDTISWMGLIVAFLSGLVLYLSAEFIWLLALGGVLVLLSGFFDALDGKIAKKANKSSSRGDYLDHVFDRYADVFMIGGVAVSAWCNPYIGMLALVGVLLTSYMGTQAQAVGAPRLYSGLLGRADRVVLMTIFPIVQLFAELAGHGSVSISFLEFSWMEIMMLWFGIVGNLTAIQRVAITFRSF